MRKFILIFVLLLSISQTLPAQDYMRSCGSITGWCDIPLSGAEQIVGICGLGGTEKFLTPIWVLDPFANPKITMYYWPQPGASNFSTIVPNVSGSPITYEVNGREVTVHYNQSGRFAIHADYTPNVSSDERYVKILVSDNAASKNPSAFTLTNVNNCPLAATRFTITRTNPTNPIKNHYIDVSQCDVNGNITPNGQYWQNNSAGTSGGWTTYEYAPSDIYQPILPTNFFISGRYYKVKFATSNPCSGWTESTQVLQIKSGTAVPAFNISQAGAVQISPANIKDVYNCLAAPIVLNNTTPAIACTTAPTNVRLTCYKTPNGVCGGNTVIGTDGPKTLPYQSTYNLRTIFSTNSNCNLYTEGNYSIKMEVETPLGWSATSSTQCLKVSGIGVQGATFDLCKLVDGCTNTIQVAGSQTTNAPVLMGASSCALKVAAGQVCSTASDAEVKIDRIDVPFAVGTKSNPVTGWCANGTTINLNGSLWFASWFRNNFANLPADNLFKVRLRIKNVCGWTDENIAYYSYFRIRKDCTVDDRTAGGGNSNVIQISDWNTDANVAVKMAAVSFYPNPITSVGTFQINLSAPQTGTLEVLDVHGKIVQQVFTNRSLNGNEQIELDVASLPNGVYFYRLSANEIHTGKIVKQ